MNRVPMVIKMQFTFAETRKINVSNIYFHTHVTVLLSFQPLYLFDQSVPKENTYVQSYQLYNRTCLENGYSVG